MSDREDYGLYGVYLYVPVIHEGIRRWLLSHGEAQFVALVGPKTLDARRSIFKDIRRLPVDDALAGLRSLFLARNYLVLEFDDLGKLDGVIETLVMPKDEFMIGAVRHLPPAVTPVFESAFLRWDHGNVLLSRPQTMRGHPTVSLDSIWSDLDDLASWSPDWWRQVASALVVDGRVMITAFNRPLPNEEALMIRGDPRALFNKGIKIGLSSFVHAEVHVIAQSARSGIATDGAELYVTTFPCPMCAKLLSETGIARLYYREGYSVLDGEDVLLGAGIEIVHVE